MAEFDARIKHKRDTEANWTAANPVLLNGEIIFVDTDDGLRRKVGDGTSTYSQLSFDDEDIYDTFIPKSGGTMEGTLELAADPESDMEAATKQYVDTVMTKSSGISITVLDIGSDELDLSTMDFSEYSAGTIIAIVGDA